MVWDSLCFSFGVLKNIALFSQESVFCLPDKSRKGATACWDCANVEDEKIEHIKEVFIALNKPTKPRETGGRIL